MHEHYTIQDFIKAMRVKHNSELSDLVDQINSEFDSLLDHDGPEKTEIEKLDELYSTAFHFDASLQYNL